MRRWSRQPAGAAGRSRTRAAPGAPCRGADRPSRPPPRPPVPAGALAPSSLRRSSSAAPGRRPGRTRRTPPARLRSPSVESCPDRSAWPPCSPPPRRGARRLGGRTRPAVPRAGERCPRRRPRPFGSGAGRGHGERASPRVLDPMGAGLDLSAEPGDGLGGMPLALCPGEYPRLVGVVQDLVHHRLGLLLAAPRGEGELGEEDLAGLLNHPLLTGREASLALTDRQVPDDLGHLVDVARAELLDVVLEAATPVGGHLGLVLLEDAQDLLH